MKELNLTWEQYGLLPVRIRAIYIIRDHLSEWFQSLADDAQIKEMKTNAKRSKNRKAPATARRS